MLNPPSAPSSLAAQMGDAPAPLYARVKQMISQQIQSGAWPPHYRVPSESELVNELGFSRMTINRALPILGIPDFWQQAVVGALILGAIVLDRVLALRNARRLVEAREA